MQPCCYNLFLIGSYMKLLSKIITFILCAVCLLGTFAALIFENTDTVAYAASESALKIEGNSAWIGEYPQTVCNDETTLTALSSVSPSADGYYHYGGERYAKCVAKIYTEGGGKYSDGSTPVSDETKYFKVEPIKWIVLEKDENSYLILSEVILDAHAWQTNITGNPNSADCKITVDVNGTATELPAYDWQYSEIREWLNGDFFDKAFNADAKKFVDTMTTPADMTTSDVESEDYVNLLCNAEFDKYVNSIKDKGASDYAKAQELFYHFHDYKYSFYWLNSKPVEGSYWSGYTGCVSTSRGYEIYAALSVNSDNVGIRPLIYVSAEEADVVLTDAEKEAKLYKGLEIAGIVLAVVGVIGVAVAVILDKKYCKKNGIDYKTHKPGKKFVAIFAPALAIAAIGMVMFAYPVVLNGGFGGAPTPEGIYMQINSESGDGWSQVGLTAYKFDSNGTSYYTDYYDGGSTNWRSGTWTQSGSNITVTFSGTWGFTQTYTINSSGSTLSVNGTKAYEKQSG
jgi:hypothetical protein